MTGDPAVPGSNTVTRTGPDGAIVDSCPDQPALATFLRARRDLLKPADVGLGGVQRTEYAARQWDSLLGGSHQRHRGAQRRRRSRNRRLHRVGARHVNLTEITILPTQQAV